MTGNCSCSLPNSGNSGNMFFRGTWEFCTEYKVGDVILHNGALYMALKACAGKYPEIDISYWRALNLTTTAPTEDHNILDGGYSTPQTHNHTEIRLRRDSTINWAGNNPRLGLGEIGIDMDLHRAKIGNGIDGWNELPYLDNDFYEKIEQITADFHELELTFDSFSEAFSEDVYRHIRDREEFIQAQIDMLSEASIRGSIIEINPQSGTRGFLRKSKLFIDSDGDLAQR